MRQPRLGGRPGSLGANRHHEEEEAAIPGHPIWNEALGFEEQKEWDTLGEDEGSVRKARPE